MKIAVTWYATPKPGSTVPMLDRTLLIPAFGEINITALPWVIILSDTYCLSLPVSSLKAKKLWLLHVCPNLHCWQMETKLTHLQKTPVVHTLRDTVMTLNSVNWCPDWVKPTLVISDEALFHLSEYVNAPNSRHLVCRKPHVPLHDVMSGEWCN